MNRMLDFYQEQINANLSSIPWLAQMQTAAFKQFSHVGFPTRHHEEWKYTSVDSFLNQAFAKPQDQSTAEPFTPFTVEFKQQLSICNGLIHTFDRLLKQLPAGVLVLPLTQALQSHTALIEPYLGSLLKPEHGFHWLNVAMIQCGLFIYIPQGVSIEEPIALRHYQDKPNQALHLRHLIVMEPNSQASIIESYEGAQDTSYFTNTVTEVFLAPRAALTHYKIQNEGKSAYHIGHLSVKQSAQSQCNSHSLSLGGKLVRSDISLYLQEEEAKCLMNGIYAPNDKQHIDHHTTVEHLVAHCQSEQDYKGILRGHSRAVFNGKVKVAPQAQQTKAKQQNKNILLSNTAEIDTKPQLEIFADDVVCSHGATVGQLDNEALFYLQSRGMSPDEASDYLIKAFAWDNLNRIPHPKVAEWMNQLLIGL